MDQQFPSIPGTIEEGRGQCEMPVVSRYHQYYQIMAMSNQKWDAGRGGVSCVEG
jgi:hypothetical protein